MANLKAALTAFLHEWREDVPDAWKPVLESVEPDLAAVPGHLTLEEPHEVIFPLRKGHGDARAPIGSHVFRALDGLEPNAVRAVLLGQDPYPKISRATGRCFEQGDLKSWQDRPAQSLQRMAQALLQYRSPSQDYVPNDSAWPALRERLKVEPQLLQSPSGLFDHWHGEGVLCLNTGLTLSRFDPKGTPAQDRVQPAHMALWRPIVQAILIHLARRPGMSLLVVLWGGPAHDAFVAMGIEAAASAAGNAGRVVAIKRPHPSYEAPHGAMGDAPFLNLPDPYTQANEALAKAQLPSIDW